MSDERLFTVSFGGEHQARVDEVKKLTWKEFANFLTTTPPEVKDKAEKGWYCPVEFSPVYRDSDNFIARHAITFDFDHVEPNTWDEVLEAWGGTKFAAYTTFSHIPEKPRFRVVIPLSRPASYDEFQAIARKVATDVGIELIARESFVPSQMMYMPTVKRGGVQDHQTFVNDEQAEFLNVDAVLAEYENWTDHSTWPHRKDADGVHAIKAEMTPPTEKPGIIGEFCRTFTVPEAIQRFDLPYKPTATTDRWTYTDGSRPEGAIVYDDGLKLHSHHDTDPARGQCNAFDLVRLHRFGGLDYSTASECPVSERPSFRAMVSLANSQPEIRGRLERAEQEALTLEVDDIIDDSVEKVSLFTPIEGFEFMEGPPLKWLVKSVLPRAELAVVFGESGSGKSFWVLDLAACITRGVKWRGEYRTTKGRGVIVVAEAPAGFKKRMRAYAIEHGLKKTDPLPAIIANAPNLREAKDAAAVAHAIKKWAGSAVVDFIVIDTLAAASPGANENAGEDMGKIIGHCKFLSKQTGALVILVHHSGKDASKGARGWSGLRAAADTEIEIARSGELRVARVTKMKDDGDGVEWPFRLKIKRVNAVTEDEEETSCVVEQMDPVPDEQPRAKEPMSSNEAMALSMFNVMAAGGSSVAQTDLIAGVARKLTRESDGKDRRRANAKRYMDGLVKKGFLFVDENERLTSVSVPEAPELSGESWLE